jgi:hypothetical protein
MGHADPLRGARPAIEIKPKSLARAQGYAPVLKGADPQLRSLQVDEHADRPPGLLLNLPDQVVALLVL